MNENKSYENYKNIQKMNQAHIFKENLKSV